MGRRYRWLLWVIAILGLGGCVAPPSRPVTAVPPPQHPTVVVTGRASWYGGFHQGLLTASGERYDMNALTAAHRSLPFGTRIRVVNLANDRSVVVRVNDRGPTVPGRILDLSYAAARALDAVGAGVIPVQITVLPAR
jgi:peptidoglycan lytic transglycosylase